MESTQDDAADKLVRSVDQALSSIAASAETRESAAGRIGRPLTMNDVIAAGQRAKARNVPVELRRKLLAKTVGTRTRQISHESIEQLERRPDLWPGYIAAMDKLPSIEQLRAFGASHLNPRRVR